MNPIIIGSAIFILTFGLILLDKLHRTIVALAGAVAMLIFLTKHYSQKEAFAAVDFNTIFLLMGIMLIIDIYNKSGVFH